MTSKWLENTTDVLHALQHKSPLE